MNSVPDHVRMAFGYAQALWPHDVAPGSDGVMIAWAPALAPYSVDELYRCFDGLSHAHPKFPSKAVVEEALIEARKDRERQENAARPRLSATRDGVVPPEQLDIRRKWREERIKFHRNANGTISPEMLAEIDAEVNQVGPREAAQLAKHGIHVEVTQPQKRGGAISAIEAIPPDPPPPEPLTATEWAQRWRTATDETRPSLAEDIRALPEEMRDEIRTLVVAK